MSAVFSKPITADERNQLKTLALAWSPDQQIWASGYLAGMAAASEPVALPGTGSGAEITVLYGSQTGNSQTLAESLAATAADQGLTARAVSMADYSPARLKKEKYLLLIVSTHGEGDPPDDAEDLWRFLKSDQHPDLSNLSYSVLALGDSSYANFCQTGRDFDDHLAAAGATRIVARVDCDLDYQADAKGWQQQTFESLKPLVGPADVAAPLLRAVPSHPRHSREHPFQAEVMVNQKITGRSSDKDVRHLEISLDGAGIEYEPGDSLAVIPHNPAALVQQTAAALSVDPDARVIVNGQELTLAKALTGQRELTRLTRPVLEAYAEMTGHGALQDILGSRELFAGFLDQYQVIDLLREFPGPISAQELVDVLGPIAARSYSIASSPRVHPDEVHLTVAVVDYEAFDLPHLGAASNHLSQLESGDPVSVYLDPNPRFRLPMDNNAPVIMIGPGTGIAPFRAFLQEREAMGAIGSNWLIFGDRHFDSDFLYQLDWLRWRKSGLLNRVDVAFSRDQEEKIYVQHRLAQRGAEIYQQLESGAFVYVCGDAQFMAPDVHQALGDLVSEHGGLDVDGAEAYLKALSKGGRYRRDVY